MKLRGGVVTKSESQQHQQHHRIIRISKVSKISKISRISKISKKSESRKVSSASYISDVVCLTDFSVFLLSGFLGSDLVPATFSYVPGIL